MKKAESVDEYIHTAPDELKDRLQRLRTSIKEVVPEAQEKISYGMPYYGYKGRLAYFAYFKNHIGLYIPPPIIADHKKELRNYVTSVSTIQFSLDKPLPISLIKKLVKARLEFNDSKK